mgnify:CR=1 FL=1
MSVTFMSKIKRQNGYIDLTYAQRVHCEADGREWRRPGDLAVTRKNGVSRDFDEKIDKVIAQSRKWRKWGELEVMPVDKELTENEKKKQAVIRIEEQLAELRASKISPSLISDGIPHGTDISDLSDYAAKVDELERELIQKRYDRICSFQRVQTAIEAVEDEAEKDLLTYRYLRGMKWEEIAVKMGYTWQHIHKIHAKALKNFEMR